MNTEKLLKIKKWIGLDEAAERLTSIFEERITVLDLIELGLERDIVLSVRLPYGEKFVGREMVYKEIPITEHLLELFMFRKGCEEHSLRSLSKDEVLKSYKDEFDEYLNEEFKKTCEKLSENYGSNYAEMSLEAFLKTATFGDYEYVSDPKYLSEVIYDLP
ncbi:TPA: hypothetical protein ROH25_003503, partial [Enterobacter asburiae]|nr:hypothetical protein [Enterobacter asburiae]